MGNDLGAARVTSTPGIPRAARAPSPPSRRLAAVALAAGCLSWACCSGSRAPGPGDPDNPNPDPTPDRADAGATTDSDYTAIFEAYDTIETVAGSGRITDKGVNGWRPEFEGGAATSAELSRPHIALGDAAGNIYIADKDAHAIRIVRPDGTIATVAGTGAAGDDGDAPAPAASSRLSAPNGLWLTADGTLYVLDLGNDKVRKITADGTMTTLFSIGGTGTGRGLWVADDESRAYVSAGTRLKTWTPDSGVSVLADRFGSLGNLAVSPSGELAVTDRTGHRVYRIGSDGSRTAIAGNGSPAGGGDGKPALESGLNEVRGVWFHPDGGLLLATHKGGQVWYVDTSGILHLFVDGDTDKDSHGGDGGPFDAEGKLISEPRAVTMTPDGDILITEHDGGFVRRVNRK